MKGHFSKGILFLLIFLFISSFLIGCGKTQIFGPASDTPGTQSSPGNKAGSSASETVKIKYPLNTNVTLRYYTNMNTNIKSYATSYAELELWKEMEKRTGVKIEWIHNTSDENFNLMLASGDVADIVKHNLERYPGGPDKAIADGIVLKLNNYMGSWAPNLRKYLDEHPDIDKMVKTDTGAYFVFPFIREDPLLQIYQGPIIRKDWLDDLGMNVPSTIDEWDTVLTAFKTQKGAKAPLSFRDEEFDNNGAFAGAYGVKRGMYIEDGKIVYGEIQPEFKEFLKLWNRWMSEGLLDSEFFTISVERMEEKMLKGIAGASVYNAGSAIGKWNNMMKDKDTKYKVVGAPYPTLKKGETPKFGQMDLPFVIANSVWVYAKSPNAEIACKWLDYAYGEEGHMLFNFGIEGVSYNMVDGYPEYTNLILNNPNGLSMAEIMPKYMLSSYNGPFVQDKRYLEQFYKEPEQLAAMVTWAKTDVAKYKLPTLYLMPEEIEDALQIENDVRNYCNTMIKKFVRGEEPIENFDQFVAHLKELGIEKLIAYYQAALERYNER